MPVLFHSRLPIIKLETDHPIEHRKTMSNSAAYHFQCKNSRCKFYIFKQRALTCTRSALQFASSCGNNCNPGISGVDSVDSTFPTCEVHRKPSSLFEGEQGPTDKGSSVDA